VTRALFQPFDESRLNADEQKEVELARGAGPTAYSVSDDTLKPYAAMGPTEAAGRLLQALLPLPAGESYRPSVAAALTGDGPRALARVRNAIITVLETPEYQLC
jgi:hypothetical protein